MCVNLSVKQLQHSDVDRRRAATRSTESGLDPRLLTLEITESMLIDDPEIAVIKLKELRALGVRIAMDDFGTGYSSLSYLSRFPVDIIKMDRSFLRPECTRGGGRTSQAPWSRSAARSPWRWSPRASNSTSSCSGCATSAASSARASTSRAPWSPGDLVDYPRGDLAGGVSRPASRGPSRATPPSDGERLRLPASRRQPADPRAAARRRDGPLRKPRLPAAVRRALRVAARRRSLPGGPGLGGLHALRRPHRAVAARASR